MFFRVIDRNPIPLAGDPGSLGDPNVFNLEGAAHETGWSEPLLSTLHGIVWPQPKNKEPAAVVQEYAASLAVAASLSDWQRDGNKVQIRMRDFAWLNDADFSLFLAKAAIRGLDPWSGQVFADFQWDHRRKQNNLILIASIEALRAIAHGTGLYAGLRRPRRGEARSDGYPSTCSITVLRLVNGEARKFAAEINWDDYWPGPESGTLWDVKPVVCFDTSAESASLRRAFPRELGGIYTVHELTKGRRSHGVIEGPHSGGQGTSGVNSQVASQVAEVAQMTDEEIPHTSQGFHGALLDLDICKLPERVAVVEKFRALHPGLLERDERAFYAVVLSALKRNKGKMVAAG